MANDVKCPLCEGHGQLSRPEMVGRLSDEELSQKLEEYLARLAENGEVLAGATRDFQRDVHTWNPQLPMWRRSPKE